MVAKETVKYTVYSSVKEETSNVYLLVKFKIHQLQHSSGLLDNIDIKVYFTYYYYYYYYKYLFIIVSSFYHYFHRIHFYYSYRDEISN
jgi:hypothetical protein